MSTLLYMANIVCKKQVGFCFELKKKVTQTVVKRTDLGFLCHTRPDDNSPVLIYLSYYCTALSSLVSKVDYKNSLAKIKVLPQGIAL